MNPPPAPQLVVNLPPLPPPPDFTSVNFIIACVAVVLAGATLVLAVFAIIAAAAAIWGKNELKAMILAKAGEVAETAANNRLDTYMHEQEEKATIKGSVTTGQPPAPPETEVVAEPYPGEGE